MPCLFVLMVLIVNCCQGGEIKAKTDSGKDVVLRPDGTWSFVGEFNKSKDAVLAYKSKRGIFSLSLPPGNWKKADKVDNEAAEVQFVYGDSEIFCMVIVERIQIPLNALKKIAIDNTKEASKNAKVVMEEKRVVNGREVLCMTMELTIEEVPFVYHGYYYSGEEGTIQLITMTAKNLFKELKPEMEVLLNGFEIIKKD